MPPDAPTSDSEEIALGRIVATHALRGEVRLRLYNPHSTALDRGMAVQLRLRDGRTVERSIRSLRPHKNAVLVTFVGCDTIEAAEELVGAELRVGTDVLPPLDPNEVYHFQLVGLRVYTADGAFVGAVAEVMDLPGHPVCVVRDGAREALIPFVPAFVADVDLGAGTMTITPPPGLLDA